MPLSFSISIFLHSLGGIVQALLVLGKLSLSPKETQILVVNFPDPWRDSGHLTRTALILIMGPTQ